MKVNLSNLKKISLILGAYLGVLFLFSLIFVTKTYLLPQLVVKDSQNNIRPSSSGTSKTSLKFNNSVMISDQKTAIELTYALLVERGYGVELGYDNADVAYIKSNKDPDDMYVLVALGFFGLTRGDLVVYHTSCLGCPFELIQIEHSNNIDWATDMKAKDKKSEFQKIEYISLYSDEKDREVFLKISGSEHNGTGMFTNKFKLVKVREDGIHTVFEGTNYSYDEGESHFTYSFEDVDGDKKIEIIEKGRECKINSLTTYKGAPEQSCQEVKPRIYKYKDEKFSLAE